MNAPAGLGPIMQILVPVADVEKASDFYEHVLGLSLLFKYPGNAFFDADGVRLYLARPTDADFDGRTSIYFRVADVTTTFAPLTANACATPRPIPWLLPVMSAVLPANMTGPRW